jgi:predicted ATP-grasp superfamily ATP-dependent carboligase
MRPCASISVTLSNLRASLPEPSILIAAASGRALAAAAQRAAFRPLVVDFFDDLDTRKLAVANVVAGDMERGFEAPLLIDRLLKLAQHENPIGVVYGSGFEDRTEILDEIARHFPLYGNRAEVVARTKDPRLLACACRKLAIPHPEISFDPPSEPSGWLIKRQGGGGGLHVASAGSRKLEPFEYYQRCVHGQPVSVLLVADGCRSRVLGLSQQWAASSGDRPFRFGGAVRPAKLDAASAQKIGDAAGKLAEAFGLVGLNSVDFLIAADRFHLLEINPRPGATLDIFADRRLFAFHIESCRGHLPSEPLIFTRACATAIAYAPCDLPSMPELDWPMWCMDRQKPGTQLRNGDPVCTVSAEAAEPEAARAIVGERISALREDLMTLGKSNEENAA